MATPTIQLPPQRAQTEFNLRRGSELLADPDLAKVEGRVETEKIALYFDAGALEVWICSESLTMRLFHQGNAEPEGAGADGDLLPPIFYRWLPGMPGTGNSVKDLG